jgi:hypothetical protein
LGLAEAHAPLTITDSRILTASVDDEASVDCMASEHLQVRQSGADVDKMEQKVLYVDLQHVVTAFAQIVVTPCDVWGGEVWMSGAWRFLGQYAVFCAWISAYSACLRKENVRDGRGGYVIAQTLPIPRGGCQAAHSVACHMPTGQHGTLC